MAKPESNILNPQLLLEIANAKMPFGKYKDYYLRNLPEAYLTWYHSKGFPAGKLGQQLATIYEIKLNGLEYLLQPLIVR
ncbi:DUF3820 family protein [Sphingobacterium corticis]|uniref:DUF3820 family protein n=1 Tax=Sphingobacterium corticis TaxID=1812823 RepID=A0ABW5NIW9_9SPHI